MKLYFSNLINNFNKSNILSLQNYTNNICYLYSNEGIFIYDDKTKKFFNTDVVDDDSKIILYNNYQVVINNSFIKKHYESFKIPFDYKRCDYKKEVYKLREKSPVSLVIEYENNNYYMWYIETHEDIENLMIKEDINSFLSLITNI